MQHLSNYASKITLIHRSAKLRAEQKSQQALFQNPKVEILWNTEIKAALGEKRLSGVVIEERDSGEDRRVKHAFRAFATACTCPPELPVCRCGHVATLRDLTRRAVRPSKAEVASNPRARSAVLRAAERIH